MVNKSFAHLTLSFLVLFLFACNDSPKKITEKKPTKVQAKNRTIPEGYNLCEGFEYISQNKFFLSKKESLTTYIKNAIAIKNGKGLISYIKRLHPTLNSLYEGDSGVYEGYTVEEHTLMVLDIFFKQYSIFFQDKSRRKKRERIKRKNYFKDLTVKEFLVLSLVLHDSGKFCAVEAGNKNDQTKYNIQIAHSFLKSFDFSSEIQVVAKTLIGHDSVGGYLKTLSQVKRKKISKNLEKAKRKELKNKLLYSFKQNIKESRKSGEKVKRITGAQFMLLQRLYYISDAGSYDILKKKVFNVQTSNEVMDIKNSKFDRFEEEVAQNIDDELFY